MNTDKASSSGLSVKIKELIKAQLHTVFVIGQNFGFDILPRHFYSEIPDLRVLKSTNFWRRPFAMTGILGADLEAQFAWVGNIVTSKMVQRFTQSSIYQQACSDNGAVGFGKIDAEFLHCFITRFKPKNILQIGCGVSTSVCLRAAAESGYQPRIICVEPYPTDFIKRSCEKGLIELVPKKAQEIDPALLNELQEGDLFFVDSSHTLGPAGEVTRIILELLPRLNKGAYAHFHDIYFPYDYQHELLEKSLFFQHETGLLMAFLTLNPHFQIEASLSMLHHGKQPDFAKFFPHQLPAKFVDGLQVGEGEYPSSVFLRRIST